MEESIKCSIERACELARNLEANLPNLSSDNVVRCIDEIVDILGVVKQRILSPHAHGGEGEGDEALKQEIVIEQSSGSLFQEWLSMSSTHSVNQFIQMQQLLAATNTTSSGPVGAPAPQLQIAETAATEGEASPTPRRRSRKDDPEKKTLTFPAPLFGNTEMPPDDGFTWRKYGQKEILGSNYPRSYYRCTHQKLYQCPAKKQVQRLDNNPNIYAVTYRGKHTCHMSPTAPSPLVAPQIPPLDITHSQSQDIPHTTTSSQLSPPSTAWLSSMQLSNLLRGGLDPAGGDRGGAGPSTLRFVADYPVADMADAMFNSGSSSGNSMESLFPPADEDRKS